MTIRGLVKKELIANGYPVEISSWHKRHTHVRNLYRKSVKQEGIELERTLSNKFQACMNRDDKIEELIISTHGYITRDEMQAIVDKCMENYHPYHTEVNIYIY